MLAWLLKPWLDRRRSELAERIRDLEEWHHIYEEWLVRTGDPARAAEMAKRGMVYLNWVMSEYYLPAVRETLNQYSVLLGRLND